MGWANLDTFADRRGGTVAFNMVDDAQTVVDYERVVDSAAEQGIRLRGGCFCNPGCAEHAFDYSADELADALDALGDVDALLDFLNQFVIGRGFPDRRPRRSAGRPS